MSLIIMFFVLIGGGVVQQLPPVTFLGQAKVPALVSIVVYYALHRRFAVMLLAAFAAGFMQDVLSHIPLGYSVFCFCTAGLLLSHFRKLVLLESRVTPAIFGGATGLCVTFVLAILMVRNGVITNSVPEIVFKSIGNGLLAMLCTPALFFVHRKLDLMVGNIVDGEGEETDG